METKATGAGGVGRDMTNHPAMDDGDHGGVRMGELDPAEAGGHAPVEGRPILGAEIIPALFSLHLVIDRVAGRRLHTQHAALPFAQRHLAQIGLDIRTGKPK